MKFSAVILEHIKEDLFEVSVPMTWGGYTIPRGFRVNLAPSSRRPWLLCPSPFRSVGAVALHEFALSKGVRWSAAARLYSQALRSEGVSPFRALLARLSVRFLGRNSG